MTGWSDVPHLSERIKKSLLATIPPHLVDVKTKGIPYLGSGAIYPISESEFVVDPFKVPTYWPKAYGFDPSWSRTAAVWGAYEEETDCWYLFAEYVRGQAETTVHAGAIKARGDWLQGVADPHGSLNGKGVASASFLDSYEELGLTLMLANPGGPGSVDLGINEVYNRLSTGRLKVFRTMQNWLWEYRIYRRDDKGKIVKTNDDCMDATRYLMLNGASVMSTKVEEADWDHHSYTPSDDERSSITGY